MSEFVTPNGKHIDLVNVPGTVMIKAQFREGGQLPTELKGTFTSHKIAGRMIDRYLARIADQSELQNRLENEQLAEPVKEVDTAPVTAFDQPEEKGRFDDAVDKAAGLLGTPQPSAEVIEQKAQELKDVLSKEEGTDPATGKPIEGYKYGTGDQKGLIVKKVA